MRLTREQLQSRKDKAVRFTRDVLYDDDRADEIAEESLDDYAARRRIALLNPRRTMASKSSKGPTKADLNDTLDQVQNMLDDALDPELSREELVAKVKDAYNLVAGDDADDQDEDDDSDDDSDDE